MWLSVCAPLPHTHVRLPLQEECGAVLHQWHECTEDARTTGKCRNLGHGMSGQHVFCKVREMCVGVYEACGEPLLGEGLRLADCEANRKQLLQ
jgi:hypothetical protein